MRKFVVINDRLSTLLTPLTDKRTSVQRSLYITVNHQVGRMRFCRSKTGHKNILVETFTLSNHIAPHQRFTLLCVTSSEQRYPSVVLGRNRLILVALAHRHRQHSSIARWTWHSRRTRFPNLRYIFVLCLDHR